MIVAPMAKRIRSIKAAVPTVRSVGSAVLEPGSSSGRLEVVDAAVACRVEMIVKRSFEVKKTLGSRWWIHLSNTRLYETASQSWRREAESEHRSA